MWKSTVISRDDGMITLPIQETDFGIQLISFISQIIRENHVVLNFQCHILAVDRKDQYMRNQSVESDSPCCRTL